MKFLLTAILFICTLAARGQMPSSPCGQSGGKRADVLRAEAKYSSPGSSAPVFTIPAGTKSISVYVSSETGITSGGNDFAQGDEDFITINAIIDLASNTSSGYVNYAKSTYMDGSGTNLYGWQDAPLGSFIPSTKMIGDALPALNNVNFVVANNTLTITQSNTGVHSSFFVQFLSPFSNSLNLLEPQVKSLSAGSAPANTELAIPIPAGADVIFIAGKGTNASPADLNTAEGSEEGYSNMRFTIDLQKGTTSGFITLANGGSANRRSTYAVNQLSSSYTGHLLTASPPIIMGDNTNGKSQNSGSIGIYDPAIYVSGGNLVIRRDAAYARDFDDAYVVEFYKRTGLGMSAEFVSSKIEFIPVGQSSTTGVSRTFSIPPGTNAVYFTETGNAVNKNSESNENSLEAYAYIDLAAGTATGYFYQQVGLSGMDRRDDNYAFKGVPLNGSSTRAHANTVGYRGAFNYDISFSLSADKSQLTVTNKTGLANPDYQFLLSMDNYGAKPDLAFGTPAVAFTKYPGTQKIKTVLTVCNPGAGNSLPGTPFAVYEGNPVTNPQAKLLYTGTLTEALDAGQCKTFTFDLNLTGYDNLNIGLTIVLNDDGSYVAGGIGGTVGSVFALSSLATQHAGFQECHYDNNLVNGTIAVNNTPVIDPDLDNSSAAPGTYAYLNYFDAGSTGAAIMDADMRITEPDEPYIAGATITLTNRPDADKEALALNGTLPAGIAISGDNTNVVQLTGRATLADYTAALKMLEYRNSLMTPDMADRIITTVVTDGIESSPLATTTIIIQTTPRIALKGNGAAIADNATETATANGTDFGMATGGIITHTFTVHNVGTGTIGLTGVPAVTITGVGFTITAQPAQRSIASGGSTTFDVRYDPAGQPGGTHTAVVRIPNNDPNTDRADYTFMVSATINILPVVVNNSVSGKEDETYDFKVADFTNAYSDGNQTTLYAVKIINLPQHGTLRLNDVPVTPGTEVLYADLAQLTFVPDAQWNGVTWLDWNASDGTAYATAGARLTINIAAVNDAPEITIPASASPTEDVPFPLKDIQFLDVDVATGDVTVTFTVGDGTLAATAGSGVTVGGTDQALTLEGTLSAVNAFLTAGELTYNAPQAATSAVTLVVDVSDNGNTGAGGILHDTKSMVLNITAVNDAPVASDQSKTTPEDTPVSGTVTATDVDGDALTFSKNTDPAHGKVEVNADGTYTYTPSDDYTGADEFKVTVSDGNGGTATATISITVKPVNDAPATTDQAKTTKEDTAISGTATGTDIDGDALTFTKNTDPAHGQVEVNADGTYTYTPSADYTGADEFKVTVSDGNGGTATATITISVTPVNDAPAATDQSTTTKEDTPVSGTVTATDVDGDALTFSKNTDPAHGKVEVNADGTYTYTPSDNYTGADEFKVTVSDGNGGTATATVTITVTPVNDVPVAADQSKTTKEDTPVSGTLTATDVDGYALTFSKSTDPQHGKVEVNADGTYTYTPSDNYVGPDEFKVTVSDGNGGTATATISITVTPVNDAPATTDQSKTTKEDTPVSGTVTGTDVDGDALTFSKSTDPAHGKVEVNADGTYTYTPSDNYTGADEFKVTVSDGNGGTATATISITVTPVNDAPSGNGTSQATKEDTPVSGSLTASDIDGDPVTFSVPNGPANGSVVMNPDGTYTYTPKPDFTGTDRFDVIISDGQGGSITVTVVITVAAVNDAPAGKGDTKTTHEETPVSGTVTGTDQDGDLLVFTKATDARHGAVTVNADGSYTYAPAKDYTGPDDFTVTISDGHGGATTVTVNIEVLPLNDAPAGTGDERTTNEDVPVNGAVTGEDIDGDRLTFTLADGPAHGTAAVRADGTYTYTPEADYNGADQFTVLISDGRGGTATVNVQITVIPVHDMPSGRGDAKTTPEDTPVNGSVTGITGDRVTLVYARQTGPAHGSVVVNIDGTYTYTPAPNYYGKDQFDIAITDKNGGKVIVTVNILVTPVNDPPVGNGDEKTTLESTPVAGRVTGSDIEGDALSFAAAKAPAFGSVAVNRDGTYTYTPLAGYTGPDQFTVGIADGNGGTAVVTVRITVTPVTGGIALVKTAALTADRLNITYTLTAINTSNVPLHQVTITDPLLGLQRVLPGELQPGASVSVTAAYKITQDDRERGSVSNTAEATGLTPVNKGVRDASGTTVSNNAPTVTPVPGAPKAANDAAGTRVNTPVTVPVLDNDNPGLSTFNKKSLRIIASPQYGQLVLHGDGRVTYIPESSFRGDDAFTYRVEDMNGFTTNIAAVNITVETEGLEIPTLFTPNGDGKNDVFEVRGLHKYAENEIVIVNRWGNEVYRQKNYQNNWKGDGLNEGTYYYLLRVKKTGASGWEVLKGFTTLIRKFKQ